MWGVQVSFEMTPRDPAMSWRRSKSEPPFLIWILSLCFASCLTCSSRASSDLDPTMYTFDLYFSIRWSMTFAKFSGAHCLNFTLAPGLTTK